MNQVAMVDRNTGEIKYVVSPGGNENYQDGEFVGDYKAIHISADIDPSLFIRENYWSGTEWVSKPQKPGEFYNWNGVSWQFNLDLFMLVIRRERDKKLYQSDWTQVADAPVDSEAWATYRQALRDFPSSITTETTLEELVWPTAP